MKQPTLNCFRYKTVCLSFNQLSILKVAYTRSYNGFNQQAMRDSEFLPSRQEPSTQRFARDIIGTKRSADRRQHR